MANWNLATLLSSLHGDIEHRLRTARQSLEHPVTKGDASQRVWLELLQTYLPKRYQAETAHIVDSNGVFSDQIDVVVFDRQYTPFIFTFEGATVIPAESVYAVFEAKQSLNAAHVAYARSKLGSVRKLFRTSLPIPHAGGTYPAKALGEILGGVLTFESDWSQCFGEPLRSALAIGPAETQLNVGCIAMHGHFCLDSSTGITDFIADGKPATAFFAQIDFDASISLVRFL